jgi:hypothetical protein
MQKIELFYHSILEKWPVRFLLSNILVLPLLTLSVVAFLLYPKQDFIIYSDLPYYLRIAECITYGGFYESINAYWSPLFAWLLIPVANYKNAVFLYVFVLTIINMVAMLYISKKLLLYFNIKGLIAVITLCIIASYLILIQLSKGPDGILVTFLLWLLYYTLDASLIIKNKIKIGLLGIILYLCKAYCFYFFIIYCGIRYFILNQNKQSNRNELKKSMQKICIIFAVGSMAWMSVLFWKYHKIMVSSVGTYAHAIAMPGKSLHNLDSCGLLFMPNQFSKNSTDDLAFTNPKTDWIPFANAINFNRQVAIIKSNCIAWIEILFYNQKIIFLFYLLIIFQFFRESKKKDYLPHILLLFSILFFIGYAFISYEFRHLFILLIFNVFIIAFVIENNNLFILQYTWVKHAVMATIAIMLIWPIYGYTLENKTNTVLKQKADFVIYSVGSKKNMAYYYYPHDLISYINVKSDMKIFGKITAYKDSTSLLNALNSKKIDYVIIDTTISNTHFYYKNYKPTFQFQDIQIFKHPCQTK